MNYYFFNFKTISHQASSLFLKIIWFYSWKFPWHCYHPLLKYGSNHWSCCRMGSDLDRFHSICLWMVLNFFLNIRKKLLLKFFEQPDKCCFVFFWRGLCSESICIILQWKRKIACEKNNKQIFFYYAYFETMRFSCNL